MSGVKVITSGEIKVVLDALVCAEDTILGLEEYYDMEQMLSDAIEIMFALQALMDEPIPEGDSSDGC